LEKRHEDSTAIRVRRVRHAAGAILPRLIAALLVDGLRALLELISIALGLKDSVARAIPTTRVVEHERRDGAFEHRDGFALACGALALHAPPAVCARGSAAIVNLRLLFNVLCAKLFYLCPQGKDLFA
jgi:hypothetical protein